MIFGSTGYIAGFVVERLLAAGHQVVAVRRSNTDTETRPAGLDVVVCRAPSEARKAILAAKPDVVLNMANFFSKTTEPADVAKFSAVNCELVAELCQGCVESSAVLFHVGSAWQATFDSEDPSWGSTYSLFKGLAAGIIDWYRTWHHLSAITVNLFDTYGPDDPRGKVVQFLIDSVGAVQPLQLSEGNQILELVHVSDVADAVAAGIEYIRVGGPESAGPPEAASFWCYPQEANTLRQVVEILDDLTGEPVKVNWGARPYRIGEQFDRVIEGRALVPGWTQRTPLRRGLADILEAKRARSE